MTEIPSLRIRAINDGEVDSDGDYVLYWMIAFRRCDWNFSLQRAIDLASELSKPLIVFEPLRCDYRWASDRLHQFIIQGMRDNARELNERKSVTYYPYLETEKGEGRGLLQALAKRACGVISDDFPCFFLPRMIKAAAARVPVRFELIDSNGILPMRAAEKVFARAHDFRRFLHKNLRPHLDQFPEAEPLFNLRLPVLDQIPKPIAERWPVADAEQILSDPEGLQRFPIDHDVDPAEIEGGSVAAQRTLDEFIEDRLGKYESDRNEPERQATSQLSPYLHFGHISAHQVFSRLMELEGWDPTQLSEKATGSSTGWWNCSPDAESFLDELITWREVGYNMCWQREDYDQYESLPEWARKTLGEHAGDPRDYVYSLEEFERAETHDDLWNAAQRQLVREGRIHNYLRMLWGKKILEWTDSPEDALEVMIELNNKYALDGRNPNSYSGIFWCLGRYDRAWGPERPVFGKIRFMSSENTARKLKVRDYIRRYGPSGDE